MGKAIAIVSQKGGVGKTTTVANLAASIAADGRNVLVVEIDPQGALARSLGQDPAEVLLGVGDLLLDRCGPEEALRETSVPGVKLLPASPVATIDEERLTRALLDDPHRLRTVVNGLRERFPLILLDGPPTLGVMTRATLVAADSYLVPVQAEEFSYATLPRLLQVADHVRATDNPQLRCAGLLLTMVDLRTRMAVKIVNQLHENYGDRVLVAMIPRAVQLQGMAERGKPTVLYAPGSRGAQAYMESTREILLGLELPEDDLEAVEPEEVEALLAEHETSILAPGRERSVRDYATARGERASRGARGPRVERPARAELDIALAAGELRDAARLADATSADPVLGTAPGSWDDPFEPGNPFESSRH
jgi:chromosome partitioning protein